MKTMNNLNLKYVALALLTPLACAVLSACSNKDNTILPEPVQPVNPTPTPVAETKIPVVTIETENHATINDKENYINCSVIINDDGKLYTDGTPFSGSGRIRGRGNSTWIMPKKPYKIKLDNKAKLLGMSTDNEWVLLANYSDRSLLRNSTAFEISRIVGMDWTPRSRNVELYLNNTYLGVYQLAEHVKVSEERCNLNLVDVSATETADLQADYLMELDFHFDASHQFHRT
jgi:hypothetical protein